MIICIFWIKQSRKISSFIHLIEIYWYWKAIGITRIKNTIKCHYSEQSDSRLPRFWFVITVQVLAFLFANGNGCQAIAFAKFNLLTTEHKQVNHEA